MFDWSGFLSVAEDLVGQSQLPDCQKPEALLRSAISRAYYAAFIVLRNYLRDVERNPNITNSFADLLRVHTIVRQELERSPKKTHWWAADLMRRMRTLRNKADYDDDYGSLTELLADATRITTDARAIIKQFV